VYKIKVVVVVEKSAPEDANLRVANKSLAIFQGFLKNPQVSLDFC
jgi:hypothetical protein